MADDIHRQPFTQKAKGIETIRNEARYESIRLCNQICFSLYACSKEIIRQYRKPLEALDLTYTQYLVMMCCGSRAT